MGGHIQWNEWEFDWDLVDLEGLNLLHVDFMGRRLLHKASLPAIRVWYEDGSGPFIDQMGEDGFGVFTDCDNKRVCLSAFNFDGTEWLDIRCWCSIGAYRLLQTWQLSRDGRISPLMASAGVHSPSVHIHHAYWRLDFDIDGPARNEVWTHDGDGAWSRFTTETAVRKAPGRQWLVRNRDTGRGVWILPGPNDGQADDFFCRADLAIRRYRSEEDEPWPFGCWDGLGYDNNEPVAGEDIVVWYVAHLFHDATLEEENSLGEFKQAGPILEFAEVGITSISMKQFLRAKGLSPADGVQAPMASAGIQSVKEFLLH